MRHDSITDRVRKELEKELMRREKERKMRKMKKKGSHIVWMLLGIVTLFLLLKTLLSGKKEH